MGSSWHVFLLSVGAFVIFMGFRRAVAYDGDEDDVYGYYTPTDVAKGKENYRMFVERKQQFGECWSEAMQKLETVCNQITAPALKRLAFEFADCFLPAIDGSKRTCPEDTDMANCADTFGSSFFSTYMQMFTNAKSTCFFLESQTAQRRAEEKILMVADMAQIARHQLTSLNEGQSLLVEKQHNAIMSADKIESWLGNLAERITNLQFDFIDQFTSFYSYVFYLVAVASCFVLTATQRTSGARFWLYILLTGTFAFERFCAKTKLESMVGQQDTKLIQAELSHDAQTIRQGFVFCAVIILAYFIWSYVDPYEKHFELLTKIEVMLKDSGLLQLPAVRNALECGRSVSVAKDNVDNAPRVDRASNLVRRSVHSGAPSPATPSTSNGRLSRVRTSINSPSPFRALHEERESTPVNGEGSPNNEERRGDGVRSGSIRPYNLRSGSSSPLKFPVIPVEIQRPFSRSRDVSRERTPLESMQERIVDVFNAIGNISRSASREPSPCRNGAKSGLVNVNDSDSDSD